MSTFWTHPSILALTTEKDPVDVVVERARNVVLDAIEEGWTGPPFDPFVLAKFLNISVIPRDDVNDARSIPLPGGRLQVEYNPHKPSLRVRFSIAHELAHTLFSDCSDRFWLMAINLAINQWQNRVTNGNSEHSLKKIPR